MFACRTVATSPKSAVTAMSRVNVGSVGAPVSARRTSNVSAQANGAWTASTTCRRANGCTPFFNWTRASLPSRNVSQSLTRSTRCEQAMQLKTKSSRSAFFCSRAAAYLYTLVEPHGAILLEVIGPPFIAFRSVHLSRACHECELTYQRSVVTVVFIVNTTIRPNR